MINNAIALAARGFAVFPLKPGEKAPPLIKGFPEHATTDETTIRQWWTKWPDANVGVHCAGLVVLDVDVRSGGSRSLGLLQMMHGLPDTLATLTPTGGKHLFFRLPPAHPGVGNSAGALGAGLDIKTTGGYVVGPGSVVEAGAYRFEADVPIAPVPEWLLTKLGTLMPKTRDTTPAASIADASPAVVDIAREWAAKNHKLVEGAYATACALRDRGLSLEQTLAVLVDVDGRPDTALRPKVEHAYTYAQNAPGLLRPAVASDFKAFPATPQPTPTPAGPVRRLLEVATSPGNTAGYLVKGLLGRRSQAVIYGAPGQGKTFAALDLAYHVVAGREWHGKRVRQGPALYLAFEGMGGISRRAQALVQHYGDEDVPLYIHGADMNLRDKAGREALSALLAGLPETPALIVIDTLARAMKGGDENSAQDMGALNDAIGALVEATGACILLIHHSGKNKDNGARGSSALLGAIDTELQVDNGAIYTRKQRDIEMADPIHFLLRPLTVGIDEDGDAVTSCVVMPASAPPAPADGTTLTGNTARVWGVLNDLGGPGNAPVDGQTWLDKCAEFLPPGRKGSQAFYDVRRALIKKQLLVTGPDGLFTRRLE